MKIAYLIQVHKNFEQIKELVSKLQENFEDKVHIYIHVDLKSITLKRELKNLYKESNSVFIIKTSTNVNWGGVSQVRATLTGLEEIVLSKIRYKYVSLLSGECYPLKSPKEIFDFFKNTSFDYIEFEINKLYNWRLCHYNLFSENLNNRKFLIKNFNRVLRRLQNLFQIKKKGFEEIIIYKGSNWFSLTLETVEYILNASKKKDLLEKYKYSVCSDEHYFQTILMNSKRKINVCNKNLRYIEWEVGENSPKYFNKNEINLIKTENLFIRKIK